VQGSHIPATMKDSATVSEPRGNSAVGDTRGGGADDGASVRSKHQPDSRRALPAPGPKRETKCEPQSSRRQSVGKETIAVGEG